MNEFTKSDWLVAEVLADESQSFVLWMLHSQLCRERADFKRHFGENFPVNDLLEELEGKGFLQENENILLLTDLGRRAIETLQSETANSTFQLKELVEGEAHSGIVSTEAGGFSITEEIWHSAAVLSDDSEQGKVLREYHVLRVNALLLLREGLHAILADTIANFTPIKYQRSLTLMAIQKARTENPDEAFAVAKAIIGQLIDPTVLRVAADLAGELDRVKELEDAVLTSTSLYELREDLNSDRGAWIHEYLEHIGLGQLSQSLKDDE